MITTKSVIDAVFTRIKDNSATLRVKMLSWLNSAMRDVLNERSWVFLEKTTTGLAITDNAFDMPADFGREVFIKNGIYLFTTKDRLTPQDAALADECGGEPIGYTLDDGVITIHPSASGTADLTYVATVPTAGYTDDTTDTIFPDTFKPLFERYLVTAFYEYDADAEKMPLGLQLDAKMLRTLKKADNQRKAVPPLDPKGMVR